MVLPLKLVLSFLLISVLVAAFTALPIEKWSNIFFPLVTFHRAWFPLDDCMASQTLVPAQV